MTSSASKSTTSEVDYDSVDTAGLPEDRAGDIATAAYYRAEARGFEPGRELEDWLEAESAVI